MDLTSELEANNQQAILRDKLISLVYQLKNPSVLASIIEQLSREVDSVEQDDSIDNYTPYQQKVLKRGVRKVDKREGIVSNEEAWKTFDKFLGE